MASYLPHHEGLLPTWLLLVSILSIFNTVQTYASPSLDLTRRLYGGPSSSSTLSQVTPLSARTFGTWTCLSAVVRTYAAYRVDNGDVYALAWWTFVIALVHFAVEWLAYGTVKLGRGIAPTMVVAVGSTVWMALQWGFYVK